MGKPGKMISPGLSFDSSTKPGTSALGDMLPTLWHLRDVSDHIVSSISTRATLAVPGMLPKGVDILSTTLANGALIVDLDSPPVFQAQDEVLGAQVHACLWVRHGAQPCTSILRL